MYRRQIGRERGDARRPVRAPSPKRATPRRTRCRPSLASVSASCPVHRVRHLLRTGGDVHRLREQLAGLLDRAGVPTIPFDSGVRPPRSKSRTTSVRVSSVGIRLRKRSVARIRIIEPLKLTNPVLGQPRQQVEQDRKRDPGGIAVHLVLIEPNVLKLAFIRSTRSIRSARESVSRRACHVSRSVGDASAWSTIAGSNDRSHTEVASRDRLTPSVLDGTCEDASYPAAGGHSATRVAMRSRLSTERCNRSADTTGQRNRPAVRR